MLRILIRKAWADLKSNRLQHLLIFLILMVSTATLTISLVVAKSANDPWQEIFAETNGPHVWLVGSDSDVDFTPVIENEEVVETTGIISALAYNPFVIDAQKHDVYMYSMDERPTVARPKVVDGRWLENMDEIVLDYSLASFYNLSVDDTFEVLTRDGIRSLNIVGLAVNSFWFPYHETTRDVAPGVGYIGSDTLVSIEPDPTQYAKVLGLRISDPENSKAFIEEAYNVMGTDIASSLEWQWVEELVTFTNTLTVLFLSFFAGLGLVAVGFIITNTIGGQVVANYREIGLLKAVGLTPNQVTALFLIEHMAIGLVASLAGIVLGSIAADSVTSPIADALNTAPQSVVNLQLLVIVVVMIQIAVLLATIFPAWHGSRINTVEAITVGYRRRHNKSSRVARLARWLHLPAIVVFGVKDVFTRPLRTALTVFGLMLTIFVALFAVGTTSTINSLTESGVFYNGTSADMSVKRNFLPNADLREFIQNSPAIDKFYSEYNVYGVPPGYQDPVFLRVLDDDYDAFDFDIKEGRMIQNPDEAVVGAGILTLLDAKIGDTISVYADGDELTLKIVGRYVEIRNIGKVILTDVQTYQSQIGDFEPTTYSFSVSQNASKDALQDEIIAQFGDQPQVLIMNDNPNAATTQLRDVTISLSIVLLIIAGVNLLSTSLLSIRERMRDFGILKTLGMTPAQISLSVIIGVCLIALIALALGIPLGLMVYDGFMASVGEQTGSGSDFGTMNWALLLIILPIIVGLAGLSSAIPARRAAQFEVAEALRYE